MTPPPLFIVIEGIDGTGKSLAGILGSGNGSLTLTMAGGGNLSALLVDLWSWQIASDDPNAMLVTVEV